MAHRLWHKKMLAAQVTTSSQYLAKSKQKYTVVTRARNNNDDNSCCKRLVNRMDNLDGLMWFENTGDITINNKMQLLRTCLLLFGDCCWLVAICSSTATRNWDTSKQKMGVELCTQLVHGDSSIKGLGILILSKLKREPRY